MAKRGENIRKRKDGRWEGRYIKGRKSDRTAIWGYIYGHSYAEVKKRLAIKKMEVQQFALNVENPTFFRAFPHLGKLHFLGVKTSTSAHYHYTLQHYILPVLGPHRVQALNESILENSILEIIAPADQNHKTLGNAMSKECLTLVRRICRYAVHLHIIADDIFHFVILPLRIFSHFVQSSSLMIGSKSPFTYSMLSSSRLLILFFSRKLLTADFR